MSRHLELLNTSNFVKVGFKLTDKLCAQKGFWPMKIRKNYPTG